MKTKKVEIEIPEDMEIKSIRDCTFNLDTKDRLDLVIELKKRQPRKFIFEEIEGKKEISPGEYWMESMGCIVKSTGSYKLDSSEIALKRIS